MGPFTKVFLILFLSLGTFCSAQSVTFDTPFQHPPILYMDHIFGLTQSGDFVKRNPEGKVVWQIESSDSKVVLSQIHFNHVFLVDDQGQLTVYDTEYGYRLWRLQDCDIASMTVGYPWIYYLDSKGHLGSLDFFTGQKVWTNKDLSFTDCVPMGKGSYVMGITRSHLYMISVVTGEVVKKVPLPGANLRPFTDWNRGVALSDGKSIYVFDSQDNTFLKQPLSFQVSSNVVQQKYYLTVQEDGTLLTRDLENQAVLWKKELHQPVKKVIFSQYLVAALTPSNDMLLVEKATGDVIGDPVPVTETSFEYVDFFEKEMVLNFISNTSLLKVPLKLKKTVTYDQNGT